MKKDKVDAPVYLITVTVRETGREYFTVAPSIDNACEGIEARFELPAGATQAKATRIDGIPVRVYLHPLISGRKLTDQPTEQCWAPRSDQTARCQNQARPGGFHTCKIHTIFDAPAPFGTQEYDDWISSDLSETDSKPKSTKSRARTRKTPPKPAKSISRARRNRDKA